MSAASVAPILILLSKYRERHFSSSCSGPQAFGIKSIDHVAMEVTVTDAVAGAFVAGETEDLLGVHSGEFFDDEDSSLTGHFETVDIEQR